MKYLKTFENRTKKYKYLNSKDTENIKDVIDTFIVNKNLPEIIENITLNDFQDEDFLYKDIFETLLIDKIYNKNNIYYVVDTFCRENNINNIPAIRNSVSNIIDDLYKNKYKKILTPIFDKKLIELLKNNPEEYEEIFEIYEDNLSDVVKSECEWMLKYKNYNL